MHYIAKSILTHDHTKTWIWSPNNQIQIDAYGVWIPEGGTANQCNVLNEEQKKNWINKKRRCIWYMPLKVAPIFKWHLFIFKDEIARVIGIIVNLQNNKTDGTKQIFKFKEYEHDNLSEAWIEFIQNKAKLCPFYTMCVSKYFFNLVRTAAKIAKLN